MYRSRLCLWGRTLQKVDFFLLYAAVFENKISIEEAIAIQIARCCGTGYKPVCGVGILPTPQSEEIDS